MPEPDTVLLEDSGDVRGVPALLHQEMQGYLEVVPAGRPMALYRNNAGEMQFARRDVTAEVAHRH